MKRIFALLLVLILIFTCAACAKEEVKENPNFNVSVGKHSASTYLLDSWREDKEDGTRDYYLSLYLHSESYYSILDESCVRYLDGSDYKVLTDVIDNASVQIIDHNEDNVGTSAFALIKTSKMIDSKKVYVLMDGPATYDANIKTKEDFKNKNGEMPTKEEWATTLASYSDQTPPIKEKPVVSADYKKGIIGFYEETNRIISYNQSGKLNVEKDKMYITLDVTMLTNIDAESLQSNFSSRLTPAKIDGDNIEVVSLPKNLEIYFEIQDSTLLIGYKTKDSTEISKLASSVAPYLIFEGNWGQYVIFNMSKQ